MVSGGSATDDEGGGKDANFARGSRSWTNQGPSISTGSSTGGGSPSSWSHPVVPATPGGESAFAQLDRLDIHGDDDAPPPNVSGRRKKRVARAAAGEKSGRGLRQFSMRVCEKVESKGRTTYNEVADELVAEFANPSSITSPDHQQFEEKNIRRRVYDALNVLMAMDIISKDKKEIQWKGLPHTSVNDIEDLKAERSALRSRIEKKAAHLQELEEQMVGIQRLVQKNEQLSRSDNSTSGVALPFILVQTRPHATVEVEISEDMQLVHFDFNSTPFELHDDAYVLKAMDLCGTRRSDIAHQIPSINGVECSNMFGVEQRPLPHPSIPGAVARLSSSPSVPGILKGRVKHEPDG